MEVDWYKIWTVLIFPEIILDDIYTVQYREINHPTVTSNRRMSSLNHDCEFWIIFKIFEKLSVNFESYLKLWIMSVNFELCLMYPLNHVYIFDHAPKLWTIYVNLTPGMLTVKHGF
jgi:hypothetical protein